MFKNCKNFKKLQFQILFLQNSHNGKKLRIKKKDFLMGLKNTQQLAQNVFL